MGEVYLANDMSLNRQVALKFLACEDTINDKHKANFMREAQAMATLNHPHIVNIYEVSEHNDRPFFAMEYIEGRDLRCCARDSNIALLTKLVFAIQMCEGFQEAHKAGIIHRDVKSSNIMVDEKNRIKILDFGLAISEDLPGTVDYRMGTGTLAYMAPEQVLGKQPDSRSDLYSLGTVLYELFTGEMPFFSEYQASLIFSIINEKPKRLIEINPGIPDTLETIIMKLLKKDRNSRYNNISTLLDDMRKLRDNLVKDNLQKAGDSDAARQSIAVLPFEDFSAEKNLAYFCDGVAEEIISTLSKVEGLYVVARSSAFSFKGKQKNIRDIGKILNVKTILEGSVRKANDKFRISVQLSNVSDGFQIWSEVFDYDLKDTCIIQEEIALAIMKNLKTQFIDEEKIIVMIHHTKNFEAYSEYLKGLYFWNKRTGESINKAIDHFQNAISKDRDYSLAYAGLADAFRALPDYSSYPPNEACKKAKDAVLKALELDDTLAEAHTSLAVIMNNGFDWLGAESEFKKAIKLKPGYPSARHWYALFLMYQRRFKEALQEMEIAYKQDPLSLPINRDIGTVHFYAEDHEEAIEALRKTAEMDYGFSLVHELMGRVYLEMSLYTKALNEFNIEKNNSKSWRPVQEVWAGIAYRKMGEINEANRIFARLKEQAKHRHISSYALAWISFVQENIDEGFDWLEKAYNKRDSWLCELNIEPLFINIKSDHRFKSLLEKIGLADI